MHDPIVDEVRNAREDYVRQFNFDLDEICRDLRKKQLASGARVVSLPKRPVQLQFLEKMQGIDKKTMGNPLRMLFNLFILKKIVVNHLI